LNDPRNSKAPCARPVGTGRVSSGAAV
jgi:hypothetical protein